MSSPPTTHVAVDLDAVRHNVAQILGHLRAPAALCAVVKANAYGHGAAPVARACVEAGARWLAVSTVDEGVSLRQAGVAAPVLVFMPPQPDEVPAAVEYGLTATLSRVDQVMELQREGERQGRRTDVHVYEDLGLCRFGPRDNVLDIIQTAEPWPFVQVTGVYTHFGPPGSGIALDSIEWMQKGASLRVYAAMLHEALAGVTERRLAFHAAASSMFVEHPEHHFDMVRTGTVLYGQYPDHVAASARTLDLREGWALMSRITEVHTVERGSRVGYGGEFVCRRETRVATVPVGLAHGLGVLPESQARRPTFFARARLAALEARRGRDAHLSKAQVLGSSAPIIGRISMDQCSLDVTDTPDADRGTPVRLPARRLSVSPAVPRLYVGEAG